MKNMFLLFVFAIFLCNASAQVKGQLYYKKTVDDKQTMASRIENYVIYFANNKSFETMLIGDVKEPTAQTGENNYLKTVSLTGGKRKSFIFKDFNSNKLTLADRQLFNVFLVADTLSAIKWDISNEKVDVLNYNCTKATAKFRGRSYTAWFTDEVPLPYGPWKFSGLPGLIVKISDDEKIYTYELEGLDLKTDFDVNIVNVPEAFKDDKPITHNAFMNLYLKKVKELEAQSRASAFVNGNVSGSTKITISPKMEKF